MDRTEMWVVETLKELRCRYANELERNGDCSACGDRLEGQVPLCAQGHQVCVKCKPQTSNCPLCNANFTGTKNYIAESVLSKFEEIKISLTDEDQKGNEIIVENHVEAQNSDMVQKNAHEESPPSPSNQSKITNAEETGLSVEGKGKFPCRIGDCTDELPYGRMVNHIRYLHEEFLIDVDTVQDNEYTNTWRILYQINDTFDRAIYIPNMGIFFIKIVTNEEGDIYGCVQITNSRVNAKYFHYKLEVGNKNTFVCFEGHVLGSRTVSQNNKKNGLSIHNSYVPYLLQRKKSFECILKITLLPHSPKPPKLKKENVKSRKSL